MDIGRYKAVTKPLTLDFRGEVINLEIRTNVYTLGFQRRLMRALDGQDVTVLAETFGDLIASWDLLEDGQLIPLTPEGIERVPLQILGALDKAIGESLELLSEEEKRGSSEPLDSQPPASTEPSTSLPESVPNSSNGSTTFESPTASESVPTT